MNPWGTYCTPSGFSVSKNIAVKIELTLKFPPITSFLSLSCTYAIPEGFLAEIAYENGMSISIALDLAWDWISQELGEIG